MIGEFFRATSARVKSAAKSIKRKVLQLMGRTEPEAPEQTPIERNEIASPNGCAMNLGPRYRILSGHAPNYRLYTFFGDRQ